MKILQRLLQAEELPQDHFTTVDPTPKQGTIRTIYVGPRSAAPLESVKDAELVRGVGIRGDRYAQHQGTYSGRFMTEPGRNLTLVSYTAVQARMKEYGQSFSMDKLRRNVLVEGLSGQDINDMVGREIQLGKCRLFVHRRNVPCKYREAETQCPQFMNRFWEDCGVCCEILDGGTISVGDTVSLLPGTFQPERCDIGLKPPGFFTKPAERSLQVVKDSIVSVHVAVGLALWDPVGFERIEKGYQSVGQHFWSPSAYRAGTLVITYVRTPLLLTMVLATGVGMVAMVVDTVNEQRVRAEL